MVCTKSPELEARFPDTRSEAAAEGTLAHEIAEIKLRGYFFATEWTKRKVTTAINKKKKESLYQEEMLGYTDDYVEEIKKVALSFNSAPVVAVEDECNLEMYIPEEGAHGSPDCILIHQGEMHVFDFKYGKGVPVSAVRNPQMMLYALGAYQRYKLIYEIDKVVLHIVQPRIDNFSTWETNREEILSFGEVVKETAGLALSGKGEFNPDENACRFCRARAVCRARAEKNVELAFAVDKKPETLSDAEIGEYLSKGTDVARWLEDVKEYALSACLAGRNIEGWKAVEGRSVRKWTDQEKAFETLKEKGIAEAVLYERKPITLASVEKLVGKKDFSEMVGEFIATPPGKPTLVDISDKREAITNATKAADVFK
jgi:hypothetical protein